MAGAGRRCARVAGGEDAPGAGAATVKRPEDSVGGALGGRWASGSGGKDRLAEALRSRSAGTRRPLAPDALSRTGRIRSLARRSPGPLYTCSSSPRVGQGPPLASRSPHD